MDICTAEIYSCDDDLSEDDIYISLDLNFDGMVNNYEFAEFAARGWFADGTGFHGADTIRVTTNKLEKMPDFLSYWLDTDCSGPGWCGGYDIDGDGAVDLNDFAMLE